ncbi:MAG: DNA polymerase III subunit beta [Opitutae bacterium]|nr:DNA polymerase III subunit beta [Opitutae bacterium]MBC9888851.1 DNA polymerase III subunit beta [Opitutae bacterium]
MKFTINRDHFSNGLQQVLNVVGTRATMPILSNVLIEAAEGYISLTTTNLDMGIRCRIKAEVGEAGGLTLPVRKLATIIRELPNLDVGVRSIDHQAEISSGGSQFLINGIGPEEFPSLPTFSDDRQFILSQETLAKMLRSVSYGQSTDESRYILNGVFFNFAEDKLTLVATDGRRLALISKELEIENSNPGNLILPAKSVTELLRLLGQADEIKIWFSDRQVAFQIGTEEGKEGLKDHIYLISKIVEGNYPNYHQVIPKETRHRVKIGREDLLHCIHRAALVTNEKNNSVTMKIHNDKLEINASSPELGESHESLGGIPYEGPEVKIAFNPQFLMDPLRSLTKDEVFFEFKDELSPGVFRTLESFLCVVMPIRIH